jgi:prepilin signal peptidase PulO-like enzyme (type II secretory pathway)
MNHLRLLSRSVACALIITVLADLFRREGGEFFTLPGLIVAMLFELAIMMLSESESYYPLLNYAPFFSAIFYSTSIYLVLWLYAVVKRDHELHRESLRQYYLRHPNG